MSKVPLSAKKDIPQTCPLCKVKFKNKESLVSHIGSKHKSQIPQGWSASRYENFLRTGKKEGTCVVCKKSTDWNESTWKYNRLCNNPKCKDELAKKAKKNMVAKYGVPHLLDDAEMQRKMIYSKRTSGEYRWSTDEKHKYEFMYASNQEKSFLQMLDVFLNFEPNDVFSPSPNTYVYTYEGEEHQYIPDMYISSLDLEVEIKEPKDNQNMHPKIQAVDKVKEQLKDDMMKSLPNVNYIKINGTDYSEFFALLSYLKDEPDNSVKAISSHTFLSPTYESIEYDVLQELDCIDVTEAKSYSDIDKMMDRVGVLINVARPKYSYNKLLKTLKKSVEYSNTYDELKEIEIVIKRLKIELKTQVKAEDGNYRMATEADRAVKIIDKEILPLLNSKLDSCKKPTEESLNITASKDDEEYRPLFVFLSYTGTPFSKVIKSVTREDYSHASLSLDTKLNHMMSFGTRPTDNKLGFIPVESIHDKAFTERNYSTYALYMYLAPMEEYNTAMELLNTFTSNVYKFKYNTLGCVRLLFGLETHRDESLFCSEFVSKILSTANPKLIKKDPSLMSPGDLGRTHKMIKISSGNIKDYDENKVDSTIRKILGKKGFTNVTLTN